MSNNIQQVNKNQHQAVRLKPQLDLNVIQNRNMAPVIIQEMSMMAEHLPLVFVKNSDTGEFTLVALLGLDENENLLVKNGQWQGMVPAGISHYPLGFALHPEDPKMFTITIDMDSEIVSETEGDALFDENGEHSDFLKRRVESLKNYQMGLEQTRNFVKLIASLEILEPQTLSFELKGEKKSIGGFYVIDEKKLNQIDDEKFLDLRKKNVLTPIYSHLFSVARIQRLVALANS